MNIPGEFGGGGFGYVDAHGEGVTALTVGDRVVIEPNFPCMRCAFCMQGRGNICPNKRILGVRESGCFSGFAVVPEPFVWKVPETISDDNAMLIEPTAVALHALFTSRTPPG